MKHPMRMAPWMMTMRQEGKRTSIFGGVGYNPPKTSMEPQNQVGDFQVPCSFFRVDIRIQNISKDDTYHKDHYIYSFSKGSLF